LPTRRRALTTLFVIVFTDLIGFGIVIPLLPLYAEHFRPRPWVFGLLMASFSAMQFLFAPLLGRLSDRVGRRPVLVISLLGSVVGYLCFAFAQSLGMLFASRILAGIAGANIATAQAVIADLTPPEERARGMGLIGAAFGLGFIAGPALAGLLVGFGPTVPGLGAAGFSVLALVMTVTLLPESLPRERRGLGTTGAWGGARLASAWRRPELVPLFLLAFLVVTAMAMFEVTFAQFIHAQRMESIGLLAGGIAHDLNNILTPIMLRTEMALAQVASESPARHHLNQVLSSCERARHLVKHLITFSHMTEHERKPLQLSLVVKETLKLLRAALPSTVEIRQDIRDNSGLVLADLSQMHQLIVNLCTNGARSLRRKGGVVEVSLSDLWLDHDTVDHLSNLEPGPYVRLSVRILGLRSDIEEEAISEAQEMEQSLEVSRSIVAAHEGDIIVDNQAANGTVFHVFFPRIENTGHAEAEGPSALPICAERILLVDDEEAIVETVKQMLDRLGYIVVPRTSSIEALETFRKDPEGFDLVITDLTMPRMTGSEFTKELMRLRPDIPIILCTGYSELMGEEEAKAMGIREFFKKPVRSQEMLERIRSVLDKKPA